MKQDTNFSTIPIPMNVCVKASEKDFFRFLEVRKALEEKMKELKPLEDELLNISKKYLQ